MKAFVVYVVIGMLLFSTTAGCIGLVQKNLGPHEGINYAGEPDLPAGFSAQESISPHGTVMPVESEPASSVSDADPVYPEDRYREVRNLTGRDGAMTPLTIEDSWSSRVPLYSLHYSPGFNATAVKVNVTHGPLVVMFKAMPKFSESRIAFAELTVRELPSKRIVADERIDHYVSNGTDAEQGSITGEADNLNLRQIVLFREGSYHLNVYGNQADVDIMVFTGDSPVPATTAGPVTGPDSPAEEMVWA